MRLAELQRLFAEAARGAEPAPELLSAVRPGGSLDAAGALRVYGTGHRVRLSDALAEMYEAVHWVLGDDSFFRAAADYVRLHPSASYNLSDYGDRFPEHVAALPEAAELPFLPELARFERLFQELFHEPAPARPAPGALDGLGPDARFRPARGSRLLEHRHSVYPIWTRRDGSRPPPPREDWDRPERLLLHRSGKDVFVRALQAPEHALLAALWEGRSLAEALEGTAGLEPEGLAALFSLLGGEGLLEPLPPLRDARERVI